MVVWLSRPKKVALYTSAWIEIPKAPRLVNAAYVALYTSAWIEMANTQDAECYDPSRTLHECVD